MGNRGKIGVYDHEQGRMRWYDKEEVEELHRQRRNNPVAPMIISDTIELMKHPGTGLYTESRTTFERMSRATGLVPAENKPIDFTKPTNCRDLNDKELKEVEQDVDQAVRRTWDDLKSGRAELSEEQKAYAKQINETLKSRGVSPELKGDLY